MNQGLEEPSSHSASQSFQTSSQTNVSQDNTLQPTVDDHLAYQFKTTLNLEPRMSGPKVDVRHIKKFSGVNPEPGHIESIGNQIKTLAHYANDAATAPFDNNKLENFKIGLLFSCLEGEASKWWSREGVGHFAGKSFDVVLGMVKDRYVPAAETTSQANKYEKMVYNEKNGGNLMVWVDEVIQLGRELEVPDLILCTKIKLNLPDRVRVIGAYDLHQATKVDVLRTIVKNSIDVAGDKDNLHNFNASSIFNSLDAARSQNQPPLAPQDDDAMDIDAVGINRVGFNRGSNFNGGWNGSRGRNDRRGENGQRGGRGDWNERRNDGDRRKRQALREVYASLSPNQRNELNQAGKCYNCRKADGHVVVDCPDLKF